MPPKKPPPEGKILNPATGRYVLKTGKIGKQILADLAAEKVSSKSSKSKILADLKNKCHNDADPITMENFEDMTLEELQDLVLVGPGEKKNCYVLDNIYQVYKTAVESKKPIKDPMDPSHELSDAEIADINKKMKAKDSKYKPPKFVSPKPYPKGYELVINYSTVYQGYFTIKVMKNTQVKFDLGLIPGWVEVTHTKSADYTTGVLLANIRELWEKKKFMDSVSQCCNVTLRRNYTYWQGSGWRQKFIDLCNEVKNLLDS